MAEKVPVIMIQPMGGMGINYVSGEEVLVPQYVADAWAEAQIAAPKKGKASSTAKVHPDPVAPEPDAAAAQAQADADAAAQAQAGGANP